MVRKVNMNGTCKSFLKVFLTSMGILECPKTKRALKDFFTPAKHVCGICILSQSILSSLKWTKKITLPIQCPKLELVHVQRVWWRYLKSSKFKEHNDHQWIWKNIQLFLSIFTSSVKIIANSDGMKIWMTLPHTSVFSLLWN